MEKIKKITETREVEIIEEVICNKCGEAIDEYSSYVGARMSCGYGSRIGDGVNISFDICEDCVIEIMKTFKIPPTQNNSGWLGGGIVDND